MFRFYWNNWNFRRTRGGLENGYLNRFVYTIGVLICNTLRGEIFLCESSCIDYGRNWSSTRPDLNSDRTESEHSLERTSPFSVEGIGATIRIDMWMYFCRFVFLCLVFYFNGALLEIVGQCHCIQKYSLCSITRCKHIQFLVYYCKILCLGHLSGLSRAQKLFLRYSSLIAYGWVWTVA